MAEEIKLVGVFQDNITPKLNKLNRAINDLNRSFAKFGKKLRPIAKDMGILAMASERVADSLKAQKNAIDANSRSWNNYKKEVGKAGSAQRKAFKGVPKGGMAAPRSSGGGRGRSGGIGLAGAGGLLASANIGQRIGSAVEQGVRRGMAMSFKLMQMPFKFLGNGIAERIADEMSDVKAAGGLFAISRKMDEGFVQSFAEAEDLTKDTNRYLAKLAGALPGDTQQYVQTSKMISDGIYTMIANDKENAVKLGEQLARKRGADMSSFSNGGAEALQAAGKEIVGEMTKLTVLAGMGGMKGANSLPMLVERMGSMDEVNMGKFQRYSAIFADPMIKSALEENMAKINATGKNTAARQEALMNMLQQVVTPELVRRYQRTTEGVIEAFKSSILNPETGLLGLGRPLTESVQVFDAFGEALFTFTKDTVAGNKKIKKGTKMTAKAIRELGLSVDEVATATKEQLSLFDYLRDIFANIMIVVQPLLDTAGALAPIFEGLAKRLEGIRNATMDFQNSFERYTVTFEELAKTMDEESRGVFEATIPLRAGLSSFVRGLYKLGAFGEGAAAFDQAEGVLEKLFNPDFKDFGSVINDIIDKLLNGPAAEKIGKEIGAVFGQIVRTFADLLSGIFGDKTLESGLVKGFVDGFNMEGIDGSGALKQIVGLVFDKILDAIGAFVFTFPKESALIAAAVFGPGLLGALLPVLLSKVIIPMGAFILAKLGAMFAATPLAATISGWLGGIMPGIASFKAGMLGIGAVLKVALVVLLKFIAIAALVVGALLGVFAIFRHADLIIGSTVEAIVIALNAMKGAVGRLIQGLGWLLKKATFGFMGKGIEEAGRSMAKEAEGAIANSWKVIGQNTEKSFARTAKDFERSGNLMKGRGLKLNSELTEVGDASKMAAGEIKALSDSAAGTSLDPLKTAAEDAAGALSAMPKEISDATKKLAAENKVTPWTPEGRESGMEWYKQQMGNTPSDPAPVLASAAQQTSAELPKIEQNTAKIPTEILKNTARLKTLQDKVDFHGKAITTALASKPIQQVEIVKSIKIPVEMGMFPMGGGDPRGGGGSGPIGAKAAQMGMTMTSSFRPGDPGYHGIGRAWDYSNSTGPTPEMHRFAMWLATNYGGMLKELIYTPLGFSIKDGMQVPPYAQAGHYNHVHVAYGMGGGQPAFHASQQDAIKWEKAVAPRNSAIASVTSNSSEFGGGGTEVNMGGVTVNVSGVNDPKQIANVVAQEILGAVRKATYSEVNIA